MRMDDLTKTAMRPPLLLFAAASILLFSQALPGQLSRPPRGAALKRKDSQSNIPGLKIWQDNMTTLGKKWCDNKTYGFGWEADVWYYDGTRIYYQVADYTGDHSWDKCALHIAQQYRNYILTNNGKLPGWRVFPRGMRMAWERTHDESYKQAVILLSKNSAFAYRGGSPNDNGIRETAYIAEAYMEAEKVGEPRNPKLAQAAGYLIDDFKRIFVTGGYNIHQPFFDGLAAESLIQYYELTKDPKVPPAIKMMLDGDWEKAYDTKSHQLAYNPDPQGPTCSVGCGKFVPDISNLIAPAYAWYWRFSNDDVYRQRGDEIFGNAMHTDISYSGKIFSQNYRWSFDYVRWRSGGSMASQ